MQIAPLDEGDQFIPFGMRKSDGVCLLADPDPLVGDLDLRALRAKRAKGELDRLHLDVLPAGTGTLTSVVATDEEGFMPEKDYHRRAFPPGRLQIETLRRYEPDRPAAEGTPSIRL
jgi:hypothetical protein